MTPRCAYCLCRVCNKIQCPRGKYHCIPCYHGTILDCTFFLHKKVSKIYHIKHRYPSISTKDLADLRDTIDKILGDGSIDLVEQPRKTLHQLVKEEEQRHNAALKEIYKNAKS